MDVAEVDLKFPVLAFTNSLEILGATSLGGLTDWRNRALANAHKEIGMELVNAEGKRFIVTDIRIVGEREAFPSLRIRKFLGWSITYDVALIVEPASPLSLDEVKARVCEVIRDKPELHCANYDPAYDAPEIAEEIAKIGDIESLPEVLAEVNSARDGLELYRQAGPELIEDYHGPTDMRLYRGTQKEADQVVADLRKSPKYLQWSLDDEAK